MILDVPPEIPAETFRAFSFRDEAVLGTRMNVIVHALSRTHALNAAQAARGEIDRLDGVLNSRRRGSELVALNSAATFKASPDLFTVVALAERIREQSAGAFSGRLGRLIDLWRKATDTPPEAAQLADLAQAIHTANVRLDATTRTIHRPEPVVFALDAVAKGYIVDRALAAACDCDGVSSVLVDIGGDIACAGPGAFDVGIPDPNLPFDNASLADAVSLTSTAIATSGRGTRDRRVGKATVSPTLQPLTGAPAASHTSVTVTAPTAAEADAWATALLAMDPTDAIAFAERHNLTTRLTPRDGAFIATGSWRDLQRPGLIPIQQKAQGPGGGWHPGWQALATFTAPRRQLIRDPDFRSPYMAMWLTTPDNKPVRTLILIGKAIEWQKDNYIWWQLNRAATSKLVATRSMSTSGAGVYNVFWDGVDDRGQPVAPGTYILHVETSRERGKHTYRQLTLDFSKAERFQQVLAPTEEGGGLKVGFDHY